MFAVAKYDRIRSLSVPQVAHPTRASRSREDDALLKQQQKDRRRRERAFRKEKGKTRRDISPALVTDEAAPPQERAHKAAETTMVEHNAHAGRLATCDDKATVQPVSLSRSKEVTGVGELTVSAQSSNVFTGSLQKPAALQLSQEIDYNDALSPRSEMMRRKVLFLIFISAII